jgi:hypothetical protein
MRTRPTSSSRSSSCPTRSVLIAGWRTPRAIRERDLAAALGLVTEDFEPIRRWLRDDQPLHWEAALAMLKSFDAFNDGNKPLWKKAGDSGRARKRPDLPAPVVCDPPSSTDLPRANPGTPRSARWRAVDQTPRRHGRRADEDPGTT